MQTFLPWPSFKASARDLDAKRLGKQRVETLQLLNSSIEGLTDRRAGWFNHPARAMWQHHEAALALYGLTICEEWSSRGYSDSCYEKIANAYSRFVRKASSLCVVTRAPNWLPLWFMDDEVFDSHRCALFHKDQQHYKDYAGTFTSSEYYWPGPEDLSAFSSYSPSNDEVSVDGYRRILAIYQEGIS